MLRAASPYVLSLLLTSVVLGQGVGPQIRLDDATAAAIGAPGLAVDCAGQALAVWPAELAGGDRVIEGRWISGDAPSGGVFRVNTTPAGAHDDPVARVDDGGDFVVLWHDGALLRWRTYDAVTLVPSAEQTAAVDQIPDALDISPDGDLAAVWGDPKDLASRGRRFDAAGAPIGGLFEVAASPLPGENYGPYPVLGQARDGFRVVWKSRAFDFDALEEESEIRAQGFDNTGEATGSELLVAFASYDFSAFEGTSIGKPQVATEGDGDFTVVYGKSLRCNYGACNPQDSFARQEIERFDAAGTQIADESLPDSSSNAGGTVGSQDDFLVVWNQSDQLFSSGFTGASPGSPPELVSTNPSDPLHRPAVAVGSPSTAGAVVWTSEECGAGSAPCVYFRRLQNGPGLLADDFEGGDTGGWCRSVGGG